jgi:putative endonuclease
MHKQGFVYMMSNQSRSVLYTGVTSGLERRIYQHNKNKLIEGFTGKYNCGDLVWWESTESIMSAIQREK